MVDNSNSRTDYSIDSNCLFYLKSLAELYTNQRAYKSKQIPQSEQTFETLGTQLFGVVGIYCMYSEYVVVGKRWTYQLGRCYLNNVMLWLVIIIHILLDIKYSTSQTHLLHTLLNYYTTTYIMNHDSGFIIGIAMIFRQNSNRTYT